MPTQIASSYKHTHWIWIATTFAALWLLTISLWAYQHFLRKPSNGKYDAHERTKKTLKAIRKNLKLACNANDPHAAMQYFIQWANLQWPNQRINSLSEIQQKTDDQELTGAIFKLEKALYSQHTQQWNGTILWHSLLCFTKKYKRKMRKRSSDSLPPLYLHE